VPYSRGYDNGKIGCYLHDKIAEQQLMDIHNSTKQTEKNVDALINSLDTKAERLVEHLLAKVDPKLVPISVFGWFVAFLLVFNFAMLFGIQATERIAETAAGYFVEKAEKQVEQPK
jgi:hypothetical protein